MKELMDIDHTQRTLISERFGSPPGGYDMPCSTTRRGSSFPSLIKPRKLQRGDTVAAVSLSWGGPGAIPDRYAAGKRQLEAEFGLRVVETPHALAEPDWLARNPAARAEDLMAAFQDPAIRAVISTIGGDDSLRILPFLDFSAIRANPKVFMGYSDSTVTHLACYKARLVSFYGPSFMAGFAENGGMFPYMVESLYRTLFSAEPMGIVEPNTQGWTGERLDWADPANQQRRRSLNPSSGWKILQGDGVVQGHLLGGCLEVLDWLRGTQVWPGTEEWQGAILFIETSEEAPAPTAVVRMLRNLAAMSVLEKLAGILFGRPGGLQTPPEQFAEYDRAILQVVAEEEGLTGLPIITRMDFGHTDPFFILPYGIVAEIDCQKRQFSILEAGVSEIQDL